MILYIVYKFGDIQSTKSTDYEMTNCYFWDDTQK